MKTAVSVPEEIYRSAEALARRLRLSRSRLYATALAEFLARYHASDVTARLDALHGRKDEGLDPVVASLQHRSLPREDW